MRKTIVSGVLGVGVAVAAGAGGCGGGGKVGSGTGGTASAATASSASSTAATSTSTGIGGSGGSGGGPPSCANATPLAVGGTFDDDLSPTGAVKYYSFDGSKGQALALFTFAQRSDKSAAFDPTWIDTVLTLFDANQQQVAENNDTMEETSQDSVLFTILPADGTYCIRVEECWTWAKDPAGACLGTADKTNTTYQVGINQLDPMKAGTVEDAEAAGNAPTPLTYAKQQGGGYFETVIYGTFDSAMDSDAFSFTLPSDAFTIPAGTRGKVTFYVAPAGTSGDGSTTPAGKVYLTDPNASDPSQHIAELYGPNYTNTPRLEPPLDLTKPYVVWVEHPSTSASTNDFYVMLQAWGATAPVEVDEAANDTIAGAEMPADTPNAAGHHYYVEGDIASDTDVDNWQVPVGTSTQVLVNCGAQRAGSGVRGFTVDTFDPATMTMVSTVTELASSDAFTGYQMIPAGVKNLIVQMSTTLPHDANVTSSFYHCGIHLK